MGYSIIEQDEAYKQLEKTQFFQIYLAAIRRLARAKSGEEALSKSKILKLIHEKELFESQYPGLLPLLNKRLTELKVAKK